VIVVDASALTDYLLGRPEALDAVDAASHAARPLHAPEVIEPETLNALRRHVMRGAVSEWRASEAVTDLASTRLLRYPHAPLRERIWQLRHELTAYDAAYLALAEGLDATLITADGGLAARARDSLGAAGVRQLG
jgi:predicted nucleic acid-binding protein